MPSKTDFTPEEWTTVRSAPIGVAAYVISAAPSGLGGTAKEMIAAASALREIEQDPSAPQILKDLLAEIKPQEGSAQESWSVSLPADENQVEERAKILAALRDTAALIDSRASDDAPAIKRWLYGVGVNVANAAKEGGFLGLGGTTVSAEEQAALNDLAATLGVQP